MSPLVKQIGGIALGVALAFALAGANMYFMKQMGKSLDRNFVENAAAGNPAATIEQVGGDDDLLQSVHRICTRRAAQAKLTEAQTRAVDLSFHLEAGESELIRAAAYVACFAAEQPKRFCQKPQRQHLAEAVRQYLKLYNQMREEWQLQTGSRVAPTAAAIRPGQFAVTDIPSARVDPQLVENLRALATNGFIAASDFGGFAAFGTPREVTDALKGVEARNGTCG
ncbi:hypothetical protein [Bradyrhizobium sp.]|uniref:hypothetical protein n=1 Tax=Bradyrhizobium sp. TaxID=376 RepID=UPI002E082D5C|nr:hypothetical protein [Bradyrhizobium sp.]